jgi:pullulanase/glycogen debranching enzyme
LLATLLGAGCIQVPREGKQPVLATHVKDWRDEVIYQVLVDRFANGDVNNDYNIQPGALARYQGGDWKGIQDRLGYIQALGVTTVWISPVVRNVETDADVDAYHGYWAQDLTKVNPHYGDLAALRSLVAAAHDRGMKVVLDIVVNHMGQVCVVRDVFELAHDPNAQKAPIKSPTCGRRARRLTATIRRTAASASRPRRRS